MPISKLERAARGPVGRPAKAKPVTATAKSLGHACAYCGKEYPNGYHKEPSQIECCGEVGHVTPLPAPFNPALLKKLHAIGTTTGMKVSKIASYEYGANERGHGQRSKNNE